jgi:capsular exopolysaccharide synthesis family protein
LDNTLKTPKEVERVLQLPLIGYLMDMGKEYRFTRYVAEHPRSMYAEAVRTLRANIELQAPGEDLKVLMVTSPDQGDGKTSLSVNLATSFAQGGKKVILIDADLRRPTVHKYFSFEDRSGVSDVLEGKTDLQSAIHVWNNSKLSVLTAGESREITDDFFSPEKVEEFLDAVRPLADIIIVDNPPIAISDALVFASKVDGIVLVVRPGSTNRDLALLMKRRIDDAQGRILGVVLNGIPITKSGYYGIYRYYIPYYYGKDNGHSAKQNGHVKKEIEQKKKEVGSAANESEVVVKASKNLTKSEDVLNKIGGRLRKKKLS